MANLGWIYLLDAGRLAGARVRVHIDHTQIGDHTIPVQHVTPAAVDGPGELRDLADWIAGELAPDRGPATEGSALVTEFLLSYGAPGLRRAAQFEPEWMLIDDLTLLSGEDSTLRARLGLGVADAGAMMATMARAWDAAALPPVIALLHRLPGWCLLSREDIAALSAAAERLPEDALHFPGEWGDLAHRHATEPFDFAAVLFDSLL